MGLERTTTYVYRLSCDKCGKTTDAAFTAPEAQILARQNGWVYDFGKWDDLCEECYVGIMGENRLVRNPVTKTLDKRGVP